MVLHHIKLAKVDFNDSIVAIGNFDGLHEGHMAIFKQLNILASASTRRIALMFNPFPQDVLCPHNKVQRLGLLRDKVKMLTDKNLVDELVIIRFTQEFAQMSANDFVSKILIKQLSCKRIVVGEDFRFGKNRSGDINDLRKHNLEVEIVAPYLINNVRVSSSVIRLCAKQNNLELLRRYMGRNITYTSKVIHGKHLASTYGVPTINLSVGKVVLALRGIYIAKVHIDNKLHYMAAVSIGLNPTTDNNERYKLEAHLIDCNLNLYGRIASVEILAFLRPERKFERLENGQLVPDIDAMFRQIHEDIQKTRDYPNFI